MQIKKVTRKRRDRIVLPGQTVIYQSNRITNGKFKGFSLLQAKVLLCLIKNLQTEIKASKSGKDWKQGDLFNNYKENIRVGLELSEICGPTHYQGIYESTLQLQALSVELKSPEGGGYTRYASLFPVIDLPVKIAGKKIMFVEIRKDVAEKVIEIDKNAQGQPKFFTKYLYEVAMFAKNKYTWKLYMIIASWREKGGFKISLEELRDQLGLEENEYPRYGDFKNRVLIPAAEELRKTADCWFNCKDTGFESRKNKKVVTLSFKIIVPDMVNEIEIKVENIKNILRMHFKFKDSHIRVLNQFLGADIASDTVAAIYNKITEISIYINSVKGTDAAIKDVAAYALKSLKNSVK